jgi:hypothetical protein
MNNGNGDSIMQWQLSIAKFPKETDEDSIEPWVPQPVQ